MIGEAIIFAVVALCLVSIGIGRWPWQGMTYIQFVTLLVAGAFAVMGGLLWRYPELRRHEEVRMEQVRDTYQHPWRGEPPGARELVADGGRQ